MPDPKKPVIMVTGIGAMLKGSSFAGDAAVNVRYMLMECCLLGEYSVELVENVLTNETRARYYLSMHAYRPISVRPLLAVKIYSRPWM